MRLWFLISVLGVLAAAILFGLNHALEKEVEFRAGCKGDGLTIIDLKRDILCVDPSGRIARTSEK